MKTKLTFLLAVVLSSTAMSATLPQLEISQKVTSVTSFGSFNVHRQHNSAALSWIFSSEDVSGFIIQRSYDGTYFSTIDEVSGNAAHWNKYLDTTVEPGTIYYRLIAVMNDGTREESQVATVRIVRHK